MHNKFANQAQLDLLQLDKAAVSALKNFHHSVESDLAAEITGLYDQLDHSDNGNGATPDRSEARQEYWQAPFRGDLIDKQPEPARQPGAAADSIGMKPDQYVGSYFYLIEKLVLLALQKDGGKSRKAAPVISAILKAAGQDMAQSLESAVSGGNMADIDAQLLIMSNQILNEAEATIQTVSDQTGLMQNSVEYLEDAQNSLESEVGHASKALQHTSQSIQTVASATEELDASSRNIDSQVQASDKVAQNAIMQSETSLETVRGLEDKAMEISNVVGLIQNIAAQTRMLALNATIEAARAGDAGKGFAVVASEVKNLSSETEKAIELVNQHATEIQSATDDAAREIENVNRLIKDIGSNVSTIAAATEQQNAATTEISNSATVASSGTGQVTDTMDAVSESNVTSRNMVNKVSRISNNVVRDVEGLNKSMTLLLRTSIAGNRRKTARVPIGMIADMRVGGKTLPVNVADLGIGGASLRLHDPDLSLSSTDCVVTFRNGGNYPARIMNVSGVMVNVAFDKLPPADIAVLQGLMDKAKEHDHDYEELAVEGAVRITAAFEDAMTSKKINMEDFFDIDFQPVEGSNPQQLTTKYLPVCDEYLPDILEELITRLPKIVFAVPISRSAYLPTHNKSYSKPQGDDPVWNDANSRNRRIFDDPAGMRAARNTTSCLIQVYDRMVGGQRILLKEVDAPIFVKDRHWGNLRIAFEI